MQRLLVTGPPASGKTHWIEDRVRLAFRERREDWRLLAPTATMAEHIRNQMAREGFAFRRRLISTLAGFVEDFTGMGREISEGVLRVIVGEALDRLRLPAYEGVRELAGFRRALAGLVREVSDAGLSAAPLPLAARTVYREVERIVAERGLVFRAKALSRAAARIAQHGVGPIREVMLDGFFRLGGPELELVLALARHADVIVTLPGWQGGRRTRDALLAAGFSEVRLDQSKRSPLEQVTESPTMTQEVEEIARAIADDASRGRAFREMGVLLRSRDPYLPAIETAFERFGIPARYHFTRTLNTNVVARYWAAAIEALRSGWDHERTLAVLRMAMAGANDRFLVEARKLIPGGGLGSFRRLTEDAGTLDCLDRLAELEAWQPEKPVTPEEWSTRIGAKAPELAEALAETAVAMPVRPVTLEGFWARAEEILASTPMRNRDRRRNVVHVMDVLEARQWELPVVFVCGMIERHFPRYHGTDSFVPDAARLALGLETAEERQEQERFLFAIARSRALERVVFSYPRFDGKGNENLRSFFLGDDPKAVRSRSARPASPAPRARPVPGAIRAPSLRAHIRRKHSVLSATRIEDFLQCPFRFFARRTLEIEPPPPAPEDRFDARVQGRVAHEFIEAWRPGMFADTVFDAIFEEYQRRENLGTGWRTERIKLSLLRDLRRWTRELAMASGAEFEKRFRIRVAGRQVRGRIDCVEPDSGGLVTLTDFKYSANAAAYVKEHMAGLRVQAGLYVLAAKHLYQAEPVGMYFVGLREESLKRRGWSTPTDLRELVTLAEKRTREAAEGIGAGEVVVRPADPQACERCDFLAACRVEEAVKALQAGG